MCSPAKPRIRLWQRARISSTNVLPGGDDVNDQDGQGLGDGVLRFGRVFVKSLKGCLARTESLI